MTPLGKIDDIRHSRRFAHSHETPGFLFLSPERSSCVDYMTLRKEKLATSHWHFVEYPAEIESTVPNRGTPMHASVSNSFHFGIRGSA